MSFMKNKPVVGIEFDGQRMSAALLAPSGNQAEVKKYTEASLTLDPLTAEAALAGQEIQTALHEAGIRDNRCVMCVPLKWVLSTETEVPDITGEDLESFLELHAEREFPFPTQDLRTSVSYYNLPQGYQGATIVCISASHQAKLENLARAAGLRLIGITAAITEIAPPSQDRLRVDLRILENSVGLQISAGGGVIALRSLEEVMHDEQGRRTPDVEAIFRQLRITMGKLPLVVQSAIKTIELHGAPAVLDAILPDVEAEAKARNISIKRAQANCPVQIKNAPGVDSAAVCAAALRATHTTPVFELMPPHVTQLQRFVAHVSDRSTLWLGGAAATIAIVVGGAFWWQSFTLGRLSSDWEEIREDVERIEAIQAKIRAYRPWCDDKPVSLNVLNTLSSSFPEYGTVWTQRLNINLNDEGVYEVQVNASAREDNDRLALSDALRTNKNIQNLLTGQVREQQFSFKFNYKENANAL